MWICGGCMFVVCVFSCTLYAFDSFRYKGCERRNAYLLTVLSPVRAKWIVLVPLDDKSLFRHIRESHGRRDARNIRFFFSAMRFGHVCFASIWNRNVYTHDANELRLLRVRKLSTIFGWDIRSQLSYIRNAYILTASKQQPAKWVDELWGKVMNKFWKFYLFLHTDNGCHHSYSHTHKHTLPSSW